MSRALPEPRPSFRPLYEQIKILLTQSLVAGEWKPGESIPSELDLARRYQVSQGTVRKAIDELAAEHILVRRQGKGTFVAPPKVSEFVAQSLTSLHEDLSARGERLQTKVLRLEVEPVTAHVAERLELAESERIVLLERVRYLRGEPLVVTTAYMPHALCAPILDLDTSDRSLFETYERELGLNLHRGTRAIEASTASAEIAEHLGTTEGAPVLVFSGVTYLDDGRPVEYFVGVHRGDRSRFETELFRPSGTVEREAARAAHAAS